MFERDEIEIDFGTTAIFAATVPTVTGTLRTSVVHDSARGRITVPVSRIIRSENFSALTAKLLKAGKYEHIIMYRLAPNDSGNLTDTQVPNLTLSVGGDPIMGQARPQDLAMTFNRTRATGPNVRVESQTAPLSGEALTDQPGFAAAAGAGVTLEWIPVDLTPQKHLISSLAEGAATIDIGAGGTVTTYRVAYVMVEPRSADQEARATTMQGAPTADLHLNLASPPTGEVDSIRRYAPLVVRRGVAGVVSTLK